MLMLYSRFRHGGKNDDGPLRRVVGDDVRDVCFVKFYVNLERASGPYQPVK